MKDRWRRTVLEGESPFSCVKWLETQKVSPTMWRWKMVTPNNWVTPCKIHGMYKSGSKYHSPVMYDDKEIGIAVGKNQTECVRQYFSIIETYEIQKHNDLIDQIFDRKLV
jgi:hypothetical protein